MLLDDRPKLRYFQACSLLYLQRAYWKIVLFEICVGSSYNNEIPHIPSIVEVVFVVY